MRLLEVRAHVAAVGSGLCDATAARLRAGAARLGARGPARERAGGAVHGARVLVAVTRLLEVRAHVAAVGSGLCDAAAARLRAGAARLGAGAPARERAGGAVHGARVLVAALRLGGVRTGDAADHGRDVSSAALLRAIAARLGAGRPGIKRANDAIFRALLIVKGVA